MVLSSTILVSFATAGLGPLGSSIGSLTGMLSGPAGIATAAGIAAAALGNMTRMAAAEEANIAGLRASIEAAGISYQRNAADIEKLIDKREELAFADDVQRDSLSRLVQMTGNLAEAQNLQAIAMDLARGKNMDLVSASELVGKVAEGNVGILKRYGITLAEGTTATEALDAISARFAGQSEAYAKTATAGWERFSNELANVQEDIGTALLPVMLELGTAMGDLFQDLQDSGALQAFGDGLRLVVDVLATGIGILQLFSAGIEQIADTVVTAAQVIVTAASGDFQGATDLMGALVERSQGRIDKAVAIGEAALERFADVAEASGEEAGFAAEELADRSKSAYGDIGDAADETAVQVDAAMSEIADFFTRTARSVEGNQAVYDAWAENVGESLIAAREAAQREGQALADAYDKIGSDIFDRQTGRVQGAQDVYDAYAESVGQAIIDANEEAAKVQEQANKDALAAEKQANDELLREQERAVKEAQRIFEKAEEERLKIVQQNAEDLAVVTSQMHADSITKLDDWMKAGTVSVEYGAGQMKEALALIPPAVLDDILVFDDFTLHLDNLSPEWVAALQPFVDMVNNLPLETREALGLDLEQWEFYTEQFKQLQKDQVAAFQAAQKVITGNASLGEGGGGFGPGGTQYTGGDAFYWDPNIGGWRGKAPSQGGHYTPRRGDPPLPKWLANEWERSVGTTVHGDIIVNARGSAAEEINALSALVR